jgi:hypothetical protein
MLLAGIVAVSHAGTPIDKDSQNGNYSNASFYGTVTSSYTTTTLAALSVKNGVSGRYCFNWIIVEGSTSTTAQIVDGTAGVLGSANGIQINGAGTGVPVIMQSPHLEPLCFTAGNAAYIVMGGASGTVSWAGFTQYGGSGGSQVNAGY